MNLVNIFVIILTITLTGCQSLTRNTSDISISSKYNEDVQPGTYLLAINQRNDESNLNKSSYLESVECAEYLTEELGKLGFRQVYSQHNAQYYVALNCYFHHNSVDTGYEATANYGMDYSTANSTVSSITGTGALNVQTNTVGSRLKSVNINKTSIYYQNRSAGFVIYKINSPFNYMERERVWAGLSSSSVSSADKSKRVARISDMISLTMDQFKNKENSGKIFGYPEKTITLPYEPEEISVNIDDEQYSNGAFLYTLERESNFRTHAISYYDFSYTPWQTYYFSNGHSSQYGKPNDLSSIGASAFDFKRAEMMGLFLLTTTKKPELFVLTFSKQKILAGSSYNVVIYDGETSKKIELKAKGTNENSLLLEWTEPFNDMMSQSNGKNKDFIKVYIQELNRVVEFRKDGFEENLRIAFPKAFG